MVERGTPNPKVAGSSPAWPAKQRQKETLDKGMNRYQKYVNALFIAGGLVVWLIAKHYTSVIIGYFQLGRKLGSGADFIYHGVPFALGVITFAVLRANTSSLTFTSDAVSEMTKVSWPTPKEARLGTIVVIITVLLAGIVLGFVDLGFTAIIRALIGA